MGGLGGLNREVCGAQLFPIQSGAVFANTLNARSEETSEGELTDARTDARTDGRARQRKTSAPWFASPGDRAALLFS